MSLLDGLVEKAIESASDADKQREWAEKGFDETLDFAKSSLPDPSEGDHELARVRESGEFAISKLRAHKDDLVPLGAHGLRSVLTMVAMGHYDQAAVHGAQVKLSGSSWDEVSAAVLSTAEAGNEAKRELDAQIETLKGIFKQVGIVAAKALVPILIASF